MPKSNNEAKQRLETLIKNHATVNVEQRIQNECRLTDVSTNELTISGNGSTNSGINLSTDVQMSCETNNRLAALAELEFTNELKNEMKASLQQSGLLFNQDQETDQRIKNNLINQIDSNTLQETLNNCTNDLVLTNRLTIDGDNTTNEDINLEHTRMIDCMFNNESEAETKVRLDNKVSNKIEADLKQEGLSLAASMGSSITFLLMGAGVLILVMVVFMGGSKTMKRRNY